MSAVLTARMSVLAVVAMFVPSKGGAFATLCLRREQMRGAL